MEIRKDYTTYFMKSFNIHLAICLCRTIYDACIEKTFPMYWDRKSVDDHDSTLMALFTEKILRERRWRMLIHVMNTVFLN